MPKGYLSLVLHAHLPFVRHPEYHHFLEENWLFEAITETYVPLICMMDRLVKDEVPFRLTMSLTPPLLCMLSDDLLQERFARHIDRLVELAHKEVERTRWQPQINDTAQRYLALFKETRTVFEDRCQRNLIRGFKHFQDLGVLEIITCGATHGFLPLMGVNESAVRAQIRVAVQTHERHLGKKPQGIWLAECGYFPGHDRILADEGIRFFFTDAHGVLYAHPRVKHGVFAPVLTRSGVAAFGRDIESSRSVWSAEAGYPGDVHYREFYRDIGLDLDYDYIKPYIQPTGERSMTGVKYYRITSKEVMEKEPYDWAVADERARAHAEDFLNARSHQVEQLVGLMDREPLVVSPYDAELFGHWWFEGPRFLDNVIRMAAESDVISLITPREYLERHPKIQIVDLCMSSWGDKGYGYVWLNPSNDWIYRHLHTAADRMVEAVQAHPEAEGIERRALNQMARELLLAQSSDWAFIMTTGTTVEYAVRRTKDHVSRFFQLLGDLDGGTLDENFVEDLEWRDNIFPDLQYEVYL